MVQIKKVISLPLTHFCFPKDFVEPYEIKSWEVRLLSPLPTYIFFFFLRGSVEQANHKEKEFLEHNSTAFCFSSALLPAYDMIPGRKAIPLGGSSRIFVRANL